MAEQNTLEDLFAAVAVCRACDLHRHRERSVLPEGSPSSRIMMIAQSPGETENRTGKMFTGPSGRLFDLLLKEAGVCRKDFYLTNLIKCMLPHARRPSRAQWEACTPWTDREIRLIRPGVIIPLGFQALKYLLIRQNIPRPPKKEYRHLFGKYIRTDEFLIYPLRHPTALLFNPEKKEIMSRNYAELKNIVKKFGNDPAGV
jgi:DNA polymerase